MDFDCYFYFIFDVISGSIEVLLLILILMKNKFINIYVAILIKS